MSKYQTPNLIQIVTLDRDRDVAPPQPEAWVRCHTVNPSPHAMSGPWNFAGSAELQIPYLSDLPRQTRGTFTDIAVDLNAPFFPDHPDHVHEVELILRGEIVGSKIFRNFTQRHQFILSTQLLFEDLNVLTIRSRAISGGTGAPRFLVQLFYVHKARLVRMLEDRAIWLFSSARSGSTWLGRDILCLNGTTRPMDEPGIGRMFAPLDWVAERFYNLPLKAGRVESGIEYETGVKVRGNPDIIPPFERAFMLANQENQIWSHQNQKLYLHMLKETVFQHVLDEWGVIDYDRVLFKMPNESHAADVIMRAFPTASMIFLMRDGRDVIKSRFSPFSSPDLAGTADKNLRRHAIAFYSHFWNFQIDIIQAAFDAHPVARRMLIRYEDLRTDPARWVREVFQRLGTPLTDGALATLVEATRLENLPMEEKGPDKPRQTGEIGGYAKLFSTGEIALMEAIMGPNLTRYGYHLRGCHTSAMRPTAHAG